MINTYHIFLIHSSVDGHLGCFHVFAIVYSVAINMGCMYLFECKFYPDICPGVGLLDHMVLLHLVFQGNSTLFSVVVLVPIFFKVEQNVASQAGALSLLRK